jgi:hypothetical protein
MIKPGIGYFQTEGLFPGQPIPHRSSGLPIGQAFRELEDRNLRQTPRG